MTAINEGGVCVIGVSRNSWISHKDPMIDLIIFYSVRTVQQVELHLGNDVEWTMLVSDVDDTVIGITDKDLAKIWSANNARTLGNINEPNNLNGAPRDTIVLFFDTFVASLPLHISLNYS